MVRLLPVLVALFLGTGYAAAQDNGVSACSAGCISQVFGDTTKLSCPANDSVCACNSGNLWFAIRDCITQACTGEDLDAQLNDAQASSNAQCDAIKASAGVTTVPPSSTTTTTAPTTTPPGTTTTSPSPSPDPTSTSSTEVLATSATPSSTTPATTTSSASIEAASSLQTSSLTQATTSQSTSASKTSTSASSSSASTSSTPASGVASASSSSATETSAASSSSGDLSVAAKAGIGAGAGVALLLSAILTCYILSKKRKGSQGTGTSRIPTMQISKPLPGSGRQYAHDVEAAKMSSLSTHFRKEYPSPIQPVLYSPTIGSSQYSPKSGYAPSRPSRDDDFTVQGRRYEDMLPRTQPRTMI